VSAFFLPQHGLRGGCEHGAVPAFCVWGSVLMLNGNPKLAGTIPSKIAYLPEV
jgi:hypothetical protein